MAKRKTLGLALGSGAIKGLYHIGVIKSLVKNQISIDYLAGTSIGAIVGAHFALFQDVEKLENFLTQGNWEKFKNIFEPHWGGGVIKGEKITKYLKEKYGYKRFSDTQIPLKIITTDLRAGQSFVFDHGLIATAVRASMSIPGLFEPLKYQGKYLVDGFLTEPVPDYTVKQMGADVVLAVNLDNCFKCYGLGKNQFKAGQVAWRAFEIMRQTIIKNNVNQADILLSPSGLNRYEDWRYYVLGVGFDELIKLGEKQTDKIISKLKNLLK